MSLVPRSPFPEPKGGDGHGKGGGGGGGRGGGGGDGISAAHAANTVPRPIAGHTVIPRYFSVDNLGGRYGPTIAYTYIPAHDGHCREIQMGITMGGKDTCCCKREHIVGTSEYGSGYPRLEESQSASMLGRDLPCGFWPVTFYNPIKDNEEYGSPDDRSRPGFEEVFAKFYANDKTFYLLADNLTVTNLLPEIKKSCNLGDVDVKNYVSETELDSEDIVQYYRASSIALGVKDSDLISDVLRTPSPMAESELLNCLNDTIILAAPLFDDHALGTQTPSLLTLFALPALVIMYMSR